jgi:hypothetical protein
VIVELAHLAVAHAQAINLAARVVLADTSDNGTDDGGESKKSGPIGLVVIIVLCVGCYFLFKSMSKQLRRVRENFPTELPSDPLRPQDRAQPPASTSSLATPVDGPTDSATSG